MKNIEFPKKRGIYTDVREILGQIDYQLPAQDKEQLEKLDIAYRALVAILYNFATMSGHPGGSISSGRIVSSLIYKMLDYELAVPHRNDADILSYAAGHKALGMYAMWALRNECVRLAQPALLAKEEINQLRLEDLLGFRRNKAQNTPLFQQFHVKPLGGHPEPVTPFVYTTTGASGVGDASAVGLALAAADAYGENCPIVNILEGEGGLTAGRVSEALACAATAQLKNVIFHIDWNQASIETNCVTCEGQTPGDYTQWTPVELFRIHDFNVIYVPDGHDFEQVYAAQKLALTFANHQPTAIVYRTTKGWHYGLEGKASHGAGHKFCSPEFYAALAEFEQAFGVCVPRFEGEKTPENIEANYWQVLQTVRTALEKEPALTQFIAARVQERGHMLNAYRREVRADLGDVQKIYTDFDPAQVPAEFEFKPGESYTTRGVLGNVLAYLNKQTQGTVLTGSADLYGSTNAGNASKDFPKGFFNTMTNLYSRSLSVGGICEDGLAGVCSGVSSFGRHIGVSSSYAAFLSFAHVAARLHAIGYQSGQEAKVPCNTLVLFNGHAGMPTGEDGPTHADPQALQLVQDNFPKGLGITLTPLEVDEIWPLVTRGFQLRPAILSPFVIRPSHSFIDRAVVGIAPALEAVKGVYYLQKPQGEAEGVVFVQGAGAGRIFVEGVLPEIKKHYPNMAVIYVTSRELFELLPVQEQEKLAPPAWKKIAMAITDFTLPTVDCWLHSDAGRDCTLYPHKSGQYLGSAKAPKLYEEAQMDASGQLRAISEYMKRRKQDRWQ
ncbi:MAG: hypothetical protein IJ311_06215 [Elusimicrobiaceae bacterium]|nr:hypothetical protein [Elusimicrobiaceae bacterium]